MISSDLLKVLCCPKTHQSLRPAEPAIIEKLNRGIAAGTVRNRRGEVVTERLDGGLLREDHAFLYPVQGNLPILLVDEAIPLASPDLRAR